MLKSVRVVFSFIFLISVSMIFAGCNGDAGKSEGSGEQLFRFNLATEPETLDPALMTGSPEFTAAMQLFEGLVVNDPNTLEPIPAVAKKWDISDDGLVYTFYLRDDAKWSNGDPVTANDFYYSWKRVLEPETVSEYVYQLFYVRNAKKYYERKITDFNEVGLEVIDDYTFRVTLENPTAFWLDLVAFHTLLPVNRKAVEEHGVKWTRPENIICNGPFMLTEWVPKAHITMVKNPNYYDSGAVKLDKIIAYTIEDNITSLQMLEAGESDWMNTIPITHIDKMKNKPEAHITPMMTTYYYRFNVKKKPLDDKRVRMALNLAVDKQTIVDYVTKAGQTPATTFVPPGIPGYNPPPGPEYNPEKARQLLAEAGYGPDGKKFPELQIIYNTSEGHKKIAETIQQMWMDELGIRVQLHNVEWKVYLKNLQALDYDIARAAWIADYTDPNTFLDMWVTDGGNNQTGWSSAKYDGLIESAASELDPVKRMEIMKEAEDLLINDEMPIMPIYFYVNTNLVKTYVKGMSFNLRDLHPLKYVWLEK